MKAKLKRSFFAKETALWVSGEDVEVFPQGTTGQLTKDEYGDWEFAPFTLNDVAFYVELEDIELDIPIPDWLDEIIPKDKQEAFLELIQKNAEPDYWGALINASYYKHFREWIQNTLEADEFSVDNRPKELADEAILNIIWHDHIQDFEITEHSIKLPYELDWKLMTQLQCYDEANKELCEEDYGYLPKWRWSFDGKTWKYRPQAELFEAGNTWYTIKYYEKEFQRRLL